jgi:thiamine-phosphate pyrophosphorylase
MQSIKDSPFPKLYAIIDAAQAAERPTELLARVLLDAGVKLVQYRDKKASSLDIYRVCLRLAQAVAISGGRLIVNDRADIALATGASGVHLGQEDLPPQLARKILGSGKWVGYSTHNLSQLREADSLPVDYIALGPIFPTRSKEGADPVVGLEILRQARRITTKPLVAIGGITLETVPDVISAGADSVAVIGDLMSTDVGERARQYLRALEGYG